MRGYLAYRWGLGPSPLLIGQPDTDDLLCVRALVKWPFFVIFPVNPLTPTSNSRTPEQESRQVAQLDMLGLSERGRDEHAFGAADGDPDYGRKAGRRAEVNG